MALRWETEDTYSNDNSADATKTQKLLCKDDAGNVIASFQKTTNASQTATTAYKVYRAIVTQTSTDAPVATVLENTFSDPIEWARSGIGTYAITTTSDAFATDKTYHTLHFGSAFAGDSHLLKMQLTDANTFQLVCKQINFNSEALDAIDIEGSFTVEIIVYY